MLEGRGVSVMYSPNWEGALILKNEATPYGLLSFIQGNSLTGAVDQGTMQLFSTPILSAHFPQLNPQLSWSEGRGGEVTGQLSKWRHLCAGGLLVI